MSRLFAWVVVCTTGFAPVAGAQAPITPDEAAYVRWLEERSMLFQAATHARAVSGRGDQWRHVYGDPRPRDAVRAASVWLLDYPGSVITKPGANVLGTWGDARFWDALRDLGVDLLHTGPLNRAGGVRGREFTPTNDGWFDPVSLEFDPLFGAEDDYRRMVRVAAERGGSIAGDLVPLHTGTGPDFRLAQRAYKDYPGLFTMVEVRKDDWPLLPKVDGPWDGVPVPREAVAELTKKGYLPGRINSNDADKEAKSWSGWSASGEVTGVDGKTRRWVYLHYFKPTQPTLNWLDPSFGAQRAVSGDLARLVHGYGAKVMRLDAVPFLGIEPKPGGESLHFKHPLSVTGTDTLAMMARKLGGWTFHELNVPLVELKRFTAHGPDLSYDFFTRAQCVHALLTGDARPLRLAHTMLLEAGIQPVTLVHDLQNHDEITYQLVELDHRKDESLSLGRDKATGKELKERLLNEMRDKVAGASPRNKLYRPERDGIATTFTGFVAAAVGVRDPERASPEEVERVRRGHLLLAAANALQPGVFCASSWDLVGALPIPEEAVADRTRGGDYRWVNRGGVDLLGVNPEAKASAYGLARATALYGPLPDQLKDPSSFAARLKGMLAARKRYGLAEGTLVAVPETNSPAVTLLVIELPNGRGLAVSAFNFGKEAVEEVVDLASFKAAGREATDIVTGSAANRVSADGKLTIRLGPVAGTAFVIATAP